ncbi:TPA: hypothetical protein JTO74_004385, partial [Escherichia coli]|nr:hypothetical protein [Escherichia coli]HAX6942238.1 hypothetical protein [Escherichia coli]HBE4685583.1 hypothetical protein [Escherichia coli]
MNIVSKIADLFMPSQEVSSCDNFHLFKAEYRILETTIHQDYSQRVEELTNEVIANNLDIEIDFKFETCDSFTLLISPEYCSDLQQVKDKIDNAIQFSETDDTIIICISIDKKIALDKDNKIHIFNFDNFIKNVFGANVSSILTYLNCFDLHKELLFNVWDDINSFGSETIKFVSQKDLVGSNTLSIARDSIISKRNKSCHFINDSQYKFIPDDFFLSPSGSCHSDIKNTFDSLLTTFLIVYLADTSEISVESDSNDLYIDYKFKGYRLISEVIAIKDMSNNSTSELFDIYKWVYNSGNFIDKIGLARNIISIHMVDKNMTSINHGTLKSIESGYDIYLKDNVKQYIEIKNKISEFLVGQSDKASDITKNMFSTFKTSFWSIITFFISVFLIKIITSNSYRGTVTLETLVVTLVFILFSVVYWYFTNKEVLEEKDRLLSRYDTIKNRYKDLLNEDDLNNIINTEKLKADDTAYIESRRKRFSIIWNSFNAVIAIVVLGLFCLDNNMSPSNKLEEEVK